MEKLSTIFENEGKTPRKINCRVLSFKNDTYQVADDTAILPLKIESTNSGQKKLMNGKYVKILYPKLDHELKTILINEKSRIYDAPEIEHCLGVPDPTIRSTVDVNLPEIQSSFKIISLMDLEPDTVSLQFCQTKNTV